ncbi:carboxypeptidase-like regulatory domain-containing protein [Lacinutrix sp. C3R15]|uniref:carboxypeptidase-like regulatory domain-containing protein n=1 Tax=Flavobacteriaceae TaxID=49546 RepID=UPI001C0A1BC0|nr:MULTISPECIES: carboxypeptidase-like regulatory domain-containing protein [Flavobacteriaceae]MBU2939483.1 carboxypeptidase-like regulatory domain-containing protein [Lacinutrix sp. C3R15]MDO6622798.1 carboxypeptidase-like regulatory domain-containing protein [Oceanihabitans sp. 1_MG-2023]
MKNQIHLNIKTPCSEDFNQFSSTTKGGFCGTCQKEVIDFTKMNTLEISAFFKNKETKNTCGRFKSNQLTAYNQQAKKSKAHSIISAIGLACLSLFSITFAQAQDSKKVETTGNSSEISAADQQQEIEVKGTIVDENGLALPTATVILQNSTIGTTTDFDGYFEFPKKLKKGDVLLFSYVGYETKKVIITEENATSKINLQVDMNMDTCIIMGKVASKKVYASKRK